MDQTHHRTEYYLTDLERAYVAQVFAKFIRANTTEHLPFVQLLTKLSSADQIALIYHEQD